MTRRRIEFVMALAVVVVFCFGPVTPDSRLTAATQVSVDSSCVGSLDVTSAALAAGPKCIPCSPNHPCVNPLTVCSYSGNSTHGCCLGYAGQE